MKITNFNAPKDLWIAWNKAYCHDLDRKITSLYDYLIYFNPDYMIFNSPTRKEDAWSTEDLIKAGYQIDNKEERLSLFYPGRLQWRQGFYNNSIYGDGLLEEITRWPEDLQLTLVTPKETITVIDGVLERNGMRYSHVVSRVLTGAWEKAILPSTDFQVLFLFDFFSKNAAASVGVQEGWHENSNIDEIQTLLGGEIWSTEWDIYDKRLVLLTWNKREILPSGFCCIKKTHKPSYKLSDYLILPIGNGGFYTLTPDYTNLVASFQANELNNFSNQVAFNLGSNLRYINKSNQQTLPTNATDSDVSFMNVSEDSSGNETITIGDQNDNVWLGTLDLVPNLMYSNSPSSLGEEVFADIKREYSRAVVNYKNRSEFKLLTDQKIKLNNVYIDLF